MEKLISLCHRRNNIPVIAELMRSRGCKFATLVYRLKGSEGGIRLSIQDLLEMGFVIRNPGYGHPQRPEYVIPEKYKLLASEAVQLEEVLDPTQSELIFDKWSIPILVAMATGSDQFAKLRLLLDGITPRALSQALSALEQNGWILRHVENTKPVKVVYQLQPNRMHVIEIMLAVHTSLIHP